MHSAITTAAPHNLARATGVATDDKKHMRPSAAAVSRTPTLLSSAITGSALNITRPDLDPSILDVCCDSTSSHSIDNNVRSIRFTTAASNIDRLIGSPLSTKKKPPAPLSPLSIMSDLAPNLSDSPLSESSAGPADPDAPDDSPSADGPGAGLEVEDDEHVGSLHTKNVRLRDGLKHDVSAGNVRRRLPFTPADPASPPADPASPTADPNSPSASSPSPSADSPQQSDTMLVDISNLTWSELSPCPDASADAASSSREGDEQDKWTPGGQDSAQVASAPRKNAPRRDAERREAIDRTGRRVRDVPITEEMPSLLEVVGHNLIRYGSPPEPIGLAEAEADAEYREALEAMDKRETKAAADALAVLEAEARERREAEAAEAAMSDADKAKAKAAAKAQAKADYDARMKAAAEGNPVLYQPDPARYKGVTHRVPYGISQQWERDLIEELVDRVPWWIDESRPRRSTLQSIRHSISRLGRNVRRMSVWQRARTFLRSESR